MKNKLTIITTLIAFTVLADGSYGGSATWKVNPSDNNWNNSNNWMPATVPDGSADVATFGTSSMTTVVVDVSVNHQLAALVFNPGASAFTFNVTDDIMALGGAGITNSSGTIQTFAISTGQSIGFHSNATAGDQTNFTLAPSAPFVPGVVFYDAATAGSASYTINGSLTGDVGGELQFIGLSSAAEGVFSNLGGNGAGSQGGVIDFHDSATGGNGTFTNEGGVGSGALGASTVFVDTSDAENATLIANGGVSGGGGATIKFVTNSAGGAARVELFGNGTLDLTAHNSPGLTIGSVEGDGLVLLGSSVLTVGSNRLNTTFSGVISDTASGSLTKTGNGKFTLSGVNTYTGTTTINGGTLFVTNRQGSGTGTGPVQINGGKLGGTGRISGAVTVGDGIAPEAYLTPGITNNRPATLTIRNSLTFQSDGTFHFGYTSSNPTGDKVVARGVTINSGALLFFGAIDTGTIAPGTVFTVINNTAATPIVGTFDNVPDGGTVTVGSNTFEANYEGGNGNDLTLTVVQ